MFQTKSLYCTVMGMLSSGRRGSHPRLCMPARCPLCRPEGTGIWWPAGRTKPHSVPPGISKGDDVPCTQLCLQDCREGAYLGSAAGGEDVMVALAHEIEGHAPYGLPMILSNAACCKWPCVSLTCKSKPSWACVRHGHDESPVCELVIPIPLGSAAGAHYASSRGSWDALLLGSICCSVAMTGHDQCLYCIVPLP